MNKELFLKLANQFIIRLPDPYERERKAVNEHVNNTQNEIYRKLEDDVAATWQRGEVPKMPHVPGVDEINEIAWASFPK